MNEEEYLEYIRLQTEEYKSFEHLSIRASVAQHRYLDSHFENISYLSVLDAGCGDGVGLAWFKEHNFKNVIGFELSEEKAEIARESEYLVIQGDLNFIDQYSDQIGKVDVIYASHSLEHCFQPYQVLGMFRDLLVDEGLLFLVLPYVDDKKLNEKCHVGKQELHLDKEKGHVDLINDIQELGFRMVGLWFDKKREPEIWLKFEKTNT